MNQDPVSRLAGLCESAPLEEKIVVVPHPSVGRSLSDGLLRRGTEAINLRFETISSIARSISAPLLAERGLELISRAQSLGLVERACLEVLDESGYFARLRDHPGFHQAVARTISDLRRASAAPEDLRASRFETADKKREVAAILQRYERLLERESLIDGAGMFALAIEHLRETGHGRYRGARWVVCEPPARLEARERELLELLWQTEPLVLQPEARTAETPAEVFAADGLENEVREIVGRTLRAGVVWDEIEIACIDSPVLSTMLYELMAELGVETTWERGIPIRYTRPGRAVLGFLEWIRHDCDAVLLRRLFASGVIRTGALGSGRAARLLRAAGVGWGRSRYQPRMDALVKERLRERDSDQKNDRIGHARELERLIRQLIRLVPPSEDLPVGEMAERARAFGNELAFVGSDLDGDAISAITRVLGEIASLERTGSIRLRDAVDRLYGIIDDIRIGPSSARAGAVHIASIRGAGWGGRRSLFVPGLTGSVFPGGDGQDPIILDHERRGMNRLLEGELELPGGAARRNEEDLARLMRRRPAETTISYSVARTDSPSREAPAAVVLELYRESHPGASFEEMRGDLEARLVSCVPGGTRMPVDPTDAWLAVWRDRGGAGSDWIAGVASTEPNLTAGLRAMQMRRAGTENRWTGFLEGEHPELDPSRSGQLVSASRLETLARCPYRYFLEYVLGVKTLEEISRDPEVWLEPKEYGSLLHRIFHAIMTDESAIDALPGSVEEALETATRIAERHLEDLREEIPPPTSASFRARREEVLRACEIFVLEEAAAGSDRTPFAFEVSFGFGSTEEGPFGTENPVELDVEGSTLRLRGQIDRIDRTGEDEWEVIDYKTGSPRRFGDEEWLGSGKRLQHALYAGATEELLRNAGLPGRVARSGYYFPTSKGQGRRASWSVQEHDPELKRMKRTLGDLLTVVRTGSFVHSPLKDDCFFCDYKQVCGSIEFADRLPEGMRGEGSRAWSRARELESASDGTATT